MFEKKGGFASFSCLKIRAAVPPSCLKIRAAVVLNSGKFQTTIYSYISI
jgi:hypothetical protein